MTEELYLMFGAYSESVGKSLMSFRRKAKATTKNLGLYGVSCRYDISILSSLISKVVICALLTACGVSRGSVEMPGLTDNFIDKLIGRGGGQHQHRQWLKEELVNRYPVGTKTAIILDELSSIGAVCRKDSIDEVNVCKYEILQCTHGTEFTVFFLKNTNFVSYNIHNIKIYIYSDQNKLTKIRSDIDVTGGKLDPPTGTCTLK